MAKKVILLLAAAALMIVMTACGNKAATSSATADPSAASSSAPAGGSAPQVIKLTASNFQFDQKEYHVKKGEPVTFTLENKAGNHGEMISELNVNLTGGKSQTVTPNKTGTFEIRCSVMCGTGHSTMVSKLIVE